MTDLVRGRIYRVRLQHIPDDKYFVVVSNNRRNRALDQVLAVRFTTSSKPSLDSIIEVPPGEVLSGRIVCDDIETIWPDEVQQDMGALSRATMSKVENGLRAALGL
jgi:mRNA interferase MazF